jgi:hypothetical protein
VLFRVVLRGDLAAVVRAGFFALAAVVFERADAERELVARADVALDAGVLPFPAFEDRPVFAAVVALPRAVVVFFVDDARAVVFFFAEARAVVFLAVELRPPAVFLAVVPRLVDFPFDEVDFLVERELVFFAEAKDFFDEEVFLLPDDFRADEAALFFDPLLLLLDEEREPVDFLVVAIMICPSKFIGLGLDFTAQRIAKCVPIFLY